MVDKDGLVGCESHIGEFIIVFGDGCAVQLDTYNPLWFALMLEKACVCILGPGFDLFGLDLLDDVVDDYVPEGFFVAHGFD